MDIENNLQKSRRQWIDHERIINPLFAPDIDSWKELLSEQQLLEVERMEFLMEKQIGLDEKYRRQKLTKREYAELTDLIKKWWCHRQKGTLPLNNQNNQGEKNGNSKIIHR